MKKSIYPQIDTYATHNWSPLKSPNATIRSPSLMPAEPASRREFFVLRLGENDHIDGTGDESSNRVSVRYARMDSNGLCVCALQDLKNKLVVVNLSHANQLLRMAKLFTGRARVLKPRKP
jgi:hypothetical protein